MSCSHWERTLPGKGAISVRRAPVAKSVSLSSSRGSCSSVRECEEPRPSSFRRSRFADPGLHTEDGATRKRLSIFFLIDKAVISKKDENYSTMGGSGRWVYMA